MLLFDKALSLVVAYWPYATAASATVWALYEKMGKMVADKKLAEAQRRSDAPDLVCGRFIGHVAGDPLAYYRLPENAATLLKRAKQGEKFQIRMTLINLGKRVKRAVITNHPGYVLLTKFGELQGGEGDDALVYDFQPEQFGESIKFVVEFESSSGFRQRHAYRTVHGEPVLERIDPS